MRRVGRFFAWGLVAAGITAGRADLDAAPLDPTLPFFVAQSQGDVTLASGNYGLILGTSGPTLISYNGPTFTTIATGFVYNGINVFDFHSLNVSGGANIAVTLSGNTGPVAFLSSTSINMSGSIDLSGETTGTGIRGGPGAGSVSNGGNGSGIAVPGSNGGPGGILASGGGGGGLGGSGQQGGSPAIYNQITHAFVGYLPGGGGGSTYVSLANQLVGGGSGGFGGGNTSSPLLPGGGGFGGGAIELGAVQSVSMSGAITTNGANGQAGVQLYGGGGGGSGGGVFLHATSVSISGTITALGGAGGAGYYPNSSGGSGSGGLVLAEYDSSRGGTISAVGTVNVGSGSTIGRFDVASVPEPASVLMLGMAAAGGVGVAGWRRARRGR